jgi:hypothetical protein
VLDRCAVNGLFSVVLRNVLKRNANVCICALIILTGGIIPLGIPKETIEYFRVLSDLRFAFYKEARRILVKSAFFFGHDARIIPSSRLDFSRIHSGYCLI